MLRKFRERDHPWTEHVFRCDEYHIYKDGFPVTEGHLLFIPSVNSDTCITACFVGAYRYGEKLVADGEIDAFNVGFNSGPAAGQTVDWPHVHMIPRRTGDMDDPTGGVRHVIPSKGNYKKTQES